MPDKDATSSIQSHNNAVLNKFQNEKKWVSFSVGIDATVLVNFRTHLDLMQ
jgi:hypothetical protein